MISVIIVQYNKVELTKRAIRSFTHFHRTEHEVILIDNASTDPALGTLQQEFPDIQIIFNEKNIGFGAANNMGAKIAKGNILFFLNNDTVTVSHFTSIVEREFLENPTIGIIGPRLLNEDRSFQLSAGSLPNFLREIVDKALYSFMERNVGMVGRYLEKQYRQKQTVGWVTGAALFIRRDLFMKIGGFDEEMFMYFEDIDLCLRAGQAFTQVLYFPECLIIHLKGGSATGKSPTKKIYRRSHLRYYTKHRSAIECFFLMSYFRVTGKDWE